MGAPRVDIILAVTDPTTLIGFLIGIAGIIASFVFYIRSKEHARPVFRSGNIPLIGGKTPLLPADVDVVYKGEKVQALAKTYISFWNAGRKTILGSEVVSADPLRFEADDPEVKILSARIIRVTRDVDQAELEVTENIVLLKFDFFDPKDGVTLEVIHTGIGRRVYCRGTIRGIPQGIKNADGSKLPNSYRTIRPQKRDTTNDLVPTGLRKKTASKTIWSMCLFLAAFSFVGLSFLLMKGSASVRSSISYRNYLIWAHSQANVATGLQQDGKVFLVLSAIALVLVTVFVIRSWRFNVPGKIALTAENLSDREEE